MRWNVYVEAESREAAIASIPEVGAQCVSSARWDLCGGPPARAVPTAILLAPLMALAASAAQG